VAQRAEEISEVVEAAAYGAALAREEIFPLPA
jgi:hypothetical protein